MAKIKSALFYIFLILGLFSGKTFVNAQVSNQLSIGSGINSTFLRDHSMSPLIYSGLGFSASLSYDRVKLDEMNLFQLKYDLSTIVSSGGNSALYQAFSFKNYNFYQRLIFNEHLLFLGWSNNNILALYDHQSFGNYTDRSYYFTSFGPAAAYKYSFQLFGREFDLRVVADIQLLGFFLRPSYISSSPEGFLYPEYSSVKAFFKSIEMFYPSRAWNFGCAPGISYKFKSGNSISIGYQFEYVNIQDPEPVVESQGNWMFRINTTL